MALKWKILYEKLLQEIKTLHFDEKFSSERTISIKYDLNRLTVRRAIDELIKNGFLYKVEKSGTFISKKRYFDGSLIHWNLDKFNSDVSSFRFINHKILGESLAYTRRYYIKDEFGNQESKFSGIEEIFVSKSILPDKWKKEYEKDILISLYNFISKYKLAIIYYNKKQIKTFTSNNKHYILINTNIYDLNNNLVGVSTIIQPFEDFDVTYIDFTNQSEELMKNKTKI